VPCLNPLVLASWSVGRGAVEQWPRGRWGPTRFPGCQRVGGPQRRSRILSILQVSHGRI